MIGDMIARIRKDKNMSKTELAEKTNINIGHLTHMQSIRCSIPTNIIYYR